MGIQPIDPVKLLGQIVAAAEGCVGKESWQPATNLTDKANTLASRKSLSKDKSIGSLQKRIGALYEKLDAEGQRRLELSRQSYEEKKYAEALSGYRGVVHCFGGRPCAAEAKKALAAAAADPERKRLLDQIEAKEMEQRIADMIEHPERIPGVTLKAGSSASPADKAATASRVDKIKALPVQAQGKIVTELEKLAKVYAAFPEGERAAADLKTLGADKAFQAALAKHESAQKAKGLLSLAEAYRGIGKKDKAASYCKQIIKDFPGTDLAARASEMLEDIELGAR
ncbi:MAG: hypothetical protein WBF17_24045 [Phycisphaerae bacterium]